MTQRFKWTVDRTGFSSPSSPPIARLHSGWIALLLAAAIAADFLVIAGRF